MRGARIVQQAAEEFEADGSLPDVLVTIELGTASGLGVVAMPDGNVFEADSPVEAAPSFPRNRFGNEVVSGNVRVAGVDASADGRRFRAIAA